MTARNASSTAAFYKLNRSGQFTVRTTGPNHCGTSDDLTIRYRLCVECPAKGLDARGFLFDQVRVNDWFQAQRTTALSCEAYAAYCARSLYRAIKQENGGLDIRTLQLALSPEPYAAEITFVWDGSAQTATTTTHAADLATRADQQQLGLAWGSLFA